MQITLFPHNRSACDTAVLFIADTGRTAVLRPIGAGMSLRANDFAEKQQQGKAAKKCLKIDSIGFIHLKKRSG